MQSFESTPSFDNLSTKEYPKYSIFLREGSSNITKRVKIVNKITGEEIYFVIDASGKIIPHLYAERKDNCQSSK